VGPVSGSRRGAVRAASERAVKENGSQQQPAQVTMAARLDRRLTPTHLLLAVVRDPGPLAASRAQTWCVVLGASSALLRSCMQWR